MAAPVTRARPRFAPPRAPRGVVSRPRLLDAVSRGIDDGALAVVAPAGYGKSSLLAQFATELDYRICWLSLDASCNVPEVFADQIASAVRHEERGDMSVAQMFMHILPHVDHHLRFIEEKRKILLR